MNKPLPMKSRITDENVSRYVVEKIVLDSDLEHRLRKETHTLPNGGMISGSDVGALLAILASSVQAKNAIEVGTFTGYTALMVATALPVDGKVVCCDVSTEWTDIGRKYWDEAKQSKKIDLRIAPAMDTLNALLEKHGPNSFDFAFIDADKTGYGAYYEVCMKLVRSGGLIVLDNMLRGGTVADTANQDPTVEYIRQLNKTISQDARVRSSLLTVGDGLMLAYKK
jgi:Predicted O-methyltransferase